MKKVLCALGAMCSMAVSPASASVSPAEVVNGPWATNGVFMFDAGVKTQIHCPNGSVVPRRWAINSTTAGGQAMISVVLTAYALRQKVFVVGTANCELWSDTETVWYLQIVN